MRSLLHLPLTTTILLLLHIQSTTVHAWGKEGHELVANIAYSLLSPTARSLIVNILRTTSDDDTDFLSPLAKIANWADEVRVHPQYKWTGHLHYVDVHDDDVDGGCHPSDFDKDGCAFDYARDCAKDECAVGAIVNFTNILSSYYHHDENDSVDKEEDDIWVEMKATSLKFITHIVGDVHQPLHVSRSTDTGGNDITVKLTSSNNEEEDEDDLETLYSYPTTDRNGNLYGHGHSHHHSHNLHSVWDTTIIQHAISKFYQGSFESFQQSIEQDVVSKTLQTFSSSECMDGRNKDCVSTWAQESWNYALHSAYAHVDGTEISTGDSLSDDYLEGRLEVVKKCLGMGGIRLARVLELALGTAEGKEEEELSIMAEDKKEEELSLKKMSALRGAFS
uniref:Aspergillus nuclease S(1) n=1 Tax=Ditylum brightwellii TaxID=49249 RepID=A0A7S4RWH7_9STRA|mmetsp:Transcript_25180/g.33413  ORF Transcript_25180/g.33413 Transcript_25180/m.33413 type:complete len:392 (+) Transcript_25180:280-1455(+)